MSGTHDNGGHLDAAGARAMGLATREELHEVKTEQALLRQAIDQIAASTTEIAESVKAFAAIATKFEQVIPLLHAMEAKVDQHETEMAVMRSHSIVQKVGEFDREMPGLKQAKNWVIGGMVGIVCLVGAALVALVVKSTPAQQPLMVMVKQDGTSAEVKEVKRDNANQ